MKRLYKTVSVRESADKASFVILLDDRSLLTPAKNRLDLPTRLVADEIGREWDAQGEDIVPETMPFTQLASTGVDRIAPRLDGVVDEIAAYGGSDLLCYRAKEPEELAIRQAQSWQPLLDWAAKDLGAALTTTDGIVHLAQSDDALANLRRTVAQDFSIFGLAALHTVVSGLGSLVLGLALSRGRLTPQQAYDVSRVDEDFQIEKWGEDAEAKERTDNLKRDLIAAHRFLSALNHN